MRISPVPCEYGQKQRAQHVGNLGAVRTCKVQRAAFCPPPIQPGQVQKLGKVGHLSKRCSGFSLLLLHLQTSAYSLKPQRLQRLLRRSISALLRFTHRVLLRSAISPCPSIPYLGLHFEPAFFRLMQHSVQWRLSPNPLVSIHKYAEADHAFARHGGRPYRKDDAERALGLTVDFFRRHLK